MGFLLLIVSLEFFGWEFSFGGGGRGGGGLMLISSIYLLFKEFFWVLVVF